MTSSTTSNLFELGRREVSPAAETALALLHLHPNTFFARHERGDWGDAEPWLHNDNRNAALHPTHFHAIRSFYRLDDGRLLMVLTAPNRSRTRLMLKDEFPTREVTVREGYAIWSAVYDGVPNPLIEVEEPVVDALLATLPPIRSAVDVGTGTGRLARKLARWGAEEVVGFDATPEMLAVAREKAQEEGLGRIRFEVLTVGDEALPVTSNSFDLLTCGLMLCHVADLRGTIREYVRVVRPGGWLLLTDFHPSTSAFGWRTDLITPDAIHLFPNSKHTRDEYLAALIDAGCSLIEVHDIAVDGTPYGDLSEAAMRANGWPPLCLVLLARKGR